LIFTFQTQRFRFRAIDSVFFPAGKAGNVFRGALGLLLPDIAPASRLPAGFAEPPRPFVLRAAHLDGRVIRPGDEFWLDIHIFDRTTGLMETLTRGLGELQERGLGPGRARVEMMPPGAPAEVDIDLAEKIAQPRVTVNFLTPTELKGMNSQLDKLPFRVLFARARDRVSALATQYGNGPLSIDFVGMARRAEAVRSKECSLSRREVMRQSSRTGQSHTIGGFTGFATYEGELTEFMPFLRAGWWTGVGRHTVWGNGVISCE
jgi:hypothetical protein